MDTAHNKNRRSPNPGVDFLVFLLNFRGLRGRIDRGIAATNFSFANIYHDAFQFASELRKGQFFQVYGRHNARHKYHPLQRFQNMVRKFDPIDALAREIANLGNAAFYNGVGKEITGPNFPFNHASDMQRLDAITTLPASGDYLYKQILKVKGMQVAALARERYMRGFSRVINVTDYADWQAFRNELLASKHVGARLGYSEFEDAMLFAISYKGTSVKITRRMYLINEDGTSDDEEGSLLQESKQITSDILNDFRWSQIVRSCMTIAAEQGRTRARIWLDRLVMMETPIEERKEIYKVLDWEDFGLFAYMVCPVVRVYDRSEVEFGTDFWRKLETVMGVAGRGLIVDDYMLRQFDKSIFYGPSLYAMQLNGLAKIGGGGVYVRGVTLAVATAVLTDAVSVGQANEDIRTVDSISGWKAWALRTIAEGAYSANHSFMMLKERPFDITLRNFQLITLWESIVSRSPLLTGNNYMDMSVLRSSEYRLRSLWDGVTEWVGMLGSSCNIVDRSRIIRYLSEHVTVKLYAGTSGHVASMLSLSTLDGHKRTLVVNLGRYSSARNGQVIAVAEATGLWEGSILPKALEFMPDPDEDQEAEVSDDSGVTFTYHPIKVRNAWVKWLVLGLLVLTGIWPIPLGVHFNLSLRFIVWWILLLIGFLAWYVVVVFFRIKLYWPWVDLGGVGEALFDNLLMHGLYDAGIKSYYRKLVGTRYDGIGWY